MPEVGVAVTKTVEEALGWLTNEGVCGLSTVTQSTAWHAS
jgi:hypothetical protein